MLGWLDKAMRALAAGASNRPDPRELHAQATAARASGRSRDAIELLQQAIAVDGRIAALHFSLGTALGDVDRLDEAAEAFHRALALEPAYAAARNELGCVLENLGDRAGALREFERAIAIDPEQVDAHCNRALALLGLGDYARGWPEYEWRWRRPELQVIRGMFSRDWWRGEEIRGRTILLFAEQGFGDAIQFVRYAPLVAARGARVALDCHPPLKDLLRGMPCVAEVLNDDAEIAGYELCAPLMSLPGLLKTTIDSIPGDVPYLAAPVAAARRWRERLAQNPARVRVGFVWASSPSMGYAWRKSVPVEAFGPFAGVEGVTLYSLQAGLPADQAARRPPGFPFVDCSEELVDFSETAGLIANLDLVISVDTAVAHLAGALGKPVWTLLRRSTDWRWGATGDATPWYPTMRLFRQAKEGVWSDVIAQAAGALGGFVSATLRVPAP